MPRNAFVPYDWITAEINGESLRALILISTYADSESGECWPTNATLAKALGKGERAIQKALTELKAAGLITMTDGGSKRRKIRIESPEWFDRPGAKKAPNHERNGHGSTMNETFVVQAPTMNETDVVEQCNHERNVHSNHERNVHSNHERNVHGPNKNRYREQIQGTNSSSESVLEVSKPDPPATITTDPKIEPFESGLGESLPQVRNAVENFRPRAVELVATQFKPETRDKILSVLGTAGDRWARKVTQEQADAGFPDWILDEVKGNQTPAKLAYHLLKTAWRENWTSPKADELAKREARRKRLEALK